MSDLIASVQKRLYTRAEAAAYLAMSQRQLDLKVHNGELVAVRDGRMVKFNRDELDRYAADLPSHEPGSAS